jgi:hypothetical protein
LNGGSENPPREILVLRDAEIYKLRVSLCASVAGTRRLRVVIAALNTAAEEILITSREMPEGAVVNPVESVPQLVNASGHKFEIAGVTEVEVTVGCLVTTLKALVVDGLPLPLLLVTPFVKKYRGNYPTS